MGLMRTPGPTGIGAVAPSREERADAEAVAVRSGVQVALHGTGALPHADQAVAAGGGAQRPARGRSR